MPQRDTFSVLIADDEAPARRRLIDLLGQSRVTGSIVEADNGDAAADIIARERPDMIFLDVQMPGLTGLDLVAAIGADRMPPTVFVTAYDQYAVAAFEANAQDYLLKPFSDDRFATALTRLMDRVNALAATAPAAFWDRLVVKTGGVTRLVRTEEIEWIEGTGVYVTLHSGGREILYRTPLNTLSEKLDPRHFVRIHRSAIVNMDSIVQLEQLTHGEFDAVLKSGRRVKVSRNYKTVLETRLGQRL